MRMISEYIIDSGGLSRPGYRRVKHFITDSFLSGYMDILVIATCSSYVEDPLFRAHVTMLLDK